MTAARHTPPFPDSKYEVLLIDVPWPYSGDPNKDQAAAKHYNLMTMEEICALPVKSLTAKRAAVFVWATGPKLHLAVEAMRAWGFHYRGIAYIWIKTTKAGKIITGQGVRPTFNKQMAELVLVGSTNRTGRAFPLLTEKQSQYVFAARPGGIHSRKPPEVRDRIVELLGDRPRIELFSRESVAGWDRWGNQAP